MAIEFVQATLSGSLDLYERRSDWLDRQLSKLVLGQTGTTDAQAGGYAVGRVHDGVREDIERADAKQLAASLNRDLVVPLVSLNMGPLKQYPKIRIGRPDEVDIDKLISNVTKLVPLGLKVGMSTIRDKIGLPDPDPEEELLTPTRQVSASSQDVLTLPPQADPAATSIHSTQPDRSRDAIDDAVSAIVGAEWEAMLEPVVAGLEDELATATSVEDAQAILERRMETLGINKLAEILARASFAARLAGEADEAL